MGNKSNINEKQTHTITETTFTKVSERIFEEMITNKGESVKEINENGSSVLLIFLRHLGCIFCNGVIDEVYNQLENFEKLNCVPVLVHIEGKETTEKYFSLSVKEKYSCISRINDEEGYFRKMFALNQSGFIQEATSIFTLMEKKNKLEEKGITQLYDFSITSEETYSGLFNF
jgi:thioredoxin-related protein